MALNLNYTTWGEGPRTLVLLHGFTGNHSSWDHLKPYWQQHVRAVAVDLPGHGKTPKPEVLGSEGWEELVKAIIRLIVDLGESDVDLLGYSNGARLALGVALRSPERVRRLVLESVNPGLKRGPEREVRQMADEKLAASIERDGLEAFVNKWEQQPVFEGLRKLPADVQAALRARRLSGTVEGYAASLRCMGLGVQPNYWNELPMLFVPTLLLTGANDEKFTLFAKKMTDDMRHAWRKTFPGSGHTPHLEVPEAYAEEVQAFLTAPYYSRAETFGT